MLVRHSMDTRGARPAQRGLHLGIELWSPCPAGASPFRPTRSEPGRRVRALVEALVTAGHPQTVVTTAPGRGPRALDDSRGARVLAIPSRAGHALPLARTLSRVATLAGSADVVHLHLFDRQALSTMAAVARLAAARGRAVVVHLHGSRAVPLRTGGAGSVRSRLVDAALEASVLRWADAVIVPSTRLGEVARAAGARHVSVVPPAVLPVVRPSTTRPLEQLAPGRRVVSVGPLTARRRPEALVRALELQPPDTHLLLLGTGPRRLEVDREVRRLGLDGRVHVLPTLTWQVVTDHLARADVVTTAALSGEDPTAVLLAMSLGIPVVATAVEGLPALVSDGVDGRLVPANDDEALAGALRDVLADRDRAATLGASAARRAAAGGWSAHAARVLAVLDDRPRAVAGQPRGGDGRTAGDTVAVD